MPGKDFVRFKSHRFQPLSKLILNACSTYSKVLFRTTFYVNFKRQKLLTCVLLQTNQRRLRALECFYCSDIISFMCRGFGSILRNTNIFIQLQAPQFITKKLVNLFQLHSHVSVSDSSLHALML